MTIINQPKRPGAPAFARTGYRLDPSAPRPAALLPAYPEAALKGNLAVGRTGQLMVLDRVDVMANGLTGANPPNVLGLRCGRYDDTAGDDLFFNVQSAANETVNILWEIDKFGYVNEPSFAQPVAVPGQSNWREENNYVSFYCISLSAPALGIQDSGEIMLGMRYLDAYSSTMHGVRPGSWGSKLVSMAAVTLGLPGYLNCEQILPAPGAGKFLAIHTLIMLCAAGDATHYRYGIGTSAVGTVTIAAASSTTVINVTSPTLVVNEHIGKMLVTLTGIRRGEVRQITANAAGTITVGVAFTGAPAAADTAVILDPLHEWYSAVNVNGFGQRLRLTDINIPTPENVSVWAYFEGTSSGTGAAPTTAFTDKSSVILGAEIKDVAGHNFVNLTGAPQ